MTLLKELLNEAGGKVHSVPAGSITKIPFVPPYEDDHVNPEDYDKNNPKHAKERARREAGEVARKDALKNYRPSNWPIFDDEHGTRLFDPTFVKHIKAEFGLTNRQWEKVDEIEQIRLHLEFAADYRNPMFNGSDGKPSNGKYSDWLNKRALFLQSKIKRG